MGDGAEACRSANVAGDCLRVVRTTAFGIDKYYVTWTIPNFTCYLKQGKRLRSKCFLPSPQYKHKWVLQLYPKGYKDHPKDEIGLFLLLLSCDFAEMEVRLRIGVLDKCEKEIFVTAASSSFEKNRGWGFPKVFSREDLCNDFSGMLCDGALTMFCDFTATPLECPEGDLEEEECRLLDEVGSLLDSEKFADVCVESRTRTFKAHKAILLARSPVFARLFCKDPKTRSVDMSCFDENVVKMFLKFIYKADVRCLEKYANLLLDVACQFGVEDLKLLCLKILYKKLNAKNAAGMLVLSADYECPELKNEVLNYMTEFPNVIRAKPWEELGQSQTDLALELTSEILAKSMRKKNERCLEECPINDCL